MQHVRCKGVTSLVDEHRRCAVGEMTPGSSVTGSLCWLAHAGSQQGRPLYHTLLAGVATSPRTSVPEAWSERSAAGGCATSACRKLPCNSNAVNPLDMQPLTDR